MRINGRKVDSPNEEVVVLPRPGQSLVFKLRAVVSLQPFESLYPEPLPPIKNMAGGARVPDFDDSDFKKIKRARAEALEAWLFLETIKTTEGLEWETVKSGDATTFHSVWSELAASGISAGEKMFLQRAVARVNALDEDAIVAAIESFHRSQAHPAQG